jgi:hypothetical protein
MAWRAFSKWWIPLCLISAVLCAVELWPRLMLRTQQAQLSRTLEQTVTAFRQGDSARLEARAEELNRQLRSYAGTTLRWTLYAFPLLALLTVILLMWAGFATRNRRGRSRPFGRLCTIALVHVALAFVKLGAFLLLIVPGVWLYIRLLFVSLIMLEENCGAAEAIRRSWRMTRGVFTELFLLVCCNSVLQLLSVPTLIGVVPATGFANTARAAAFRMLSPATEPPPLPPAAPAEAAAGVIH